MVRVATTINGVQEKVRMFKTSDKARSYADERIREFSACRRGLHCTDVSTNVSLTTGNVKKRMAFDNGESIEVWMAK